MSKQMMPEMEMFERAKQLLEGLRVAMDDSEIAEKDLIVISNWCADLEIAAIAIRKNAFRRFNEMKLRAIDDRAK